jgi:pilus assembly protein CpaF
MPSDPPVQLTRAPLPPRFHKLKADIHKRIVETLDLSKLNRWKQERLQKEVRGLAVQLAASASELMNEVERERLVEEVISEVFGLGPLDPLLADPHISDILVNGPHTVYIERHGRLEPTAIRFSDDAHLMAIIQRVAARVGRRVDELSPMVDARLEDGSRVNAIVPPLSTNGPVLSIRRFGVRLLGQELLANSTMPPAVLQFLKAAVACRLSTLVSGGTGSGKTTLLNALSQFIPSEERLVTIEDAAELKLAQRHVISLETRPSNVEGVGEIKQRELVRNALRMRPDRIIVGECRGAEALDMLQAMNTGHEGSLTTVHANDALDALTRLEIMVMMAGFDLPVPVIRYYVSSALKLVVHLSRLKGGARKVVRVVEVLGSDPAPYHTREIFGFRQKGVRNGRAFGEFYTTGYRPKCLEEMRGMGVELPDEIFTEGVTPDA